MNSFLTFIFYSIVVNAVVSAQDEPFEQRVAGGINSGVDHAADGITNFRQGVSNFGDAARDRVVGAAGAVGNDFENLKDGAGQWFSNAGNRIGEWWTGAGNAASNFGQGVKNGVYSAGQKVNDGAHYIYDGAGNIVGNTQDAVGRRLQTAGEHLQNNDRTDYNQ